MTDVSADGVERELKFHVAEGFVVPYLGGDGRTHAPGRRITLDATYWDTPDLRLTRRGHSLRHRASADGSGLLLLDETTEPAVHIVARRSATSARPATTSLTLTGQDGRRRTITP